MRIYLVSFLAFLLTVSCTKDRDPISASFTFNDLFSGSLDGNGDLVIETDRSSYAWRQSETSLTIIIKGTVVNDSETLYYSRTGDGFGPQEQNMLFFSDNSSGYLEIYDESENAWREVAFSSVMVEGARVVPLKPKKHYALEAFLIWQENKEKNGIFRLRIDYYDQSEPGEKAIRFQDYSGMFTIGSWP